MERITARRVYLKRRYFLYGCSRRVKDRAPALQSGSLSHYFWRLVGPPWFHAARAFVREAGWLRGR
jgi:hypothetical protein